MEKMRTNLILSFSYSSKQSKVYTPYEPMRSLTGEAAYQRYSGKERSSSSGIQRVVCVSRCVAPCRLPLSRDKTALLTTGYACNFLLGAGRRIFPPHRVTACSFSRRNTEVPRPGAASGKFETARSLPDF